MVSVMEILLVAVAAFLLGRVAWDKRPRPVEPPIVLQEQEAAEQLYGRRQ